MLTKCAHDRMIVSFFVQEAEKENFEQDSNTHAPDLQIPGKVFERAS